MFASPVRCPSSRIRSCVLTLTVIASLLIPMILIGESERTKAKARRTAEAPPNNAPPQEFAIGESAAPS